MRPDWFVISLVGVVAAAIALPSRGDAAEAIRLLGFAAISALFFLQGARLSRAAVFAGMTHWRLHSIIAATTFLLYPLIGLALVSAMPKLLPSPLWAGVLFLCALPSTIQSSVALTSVANGNIAGAVCAATASSLSGIVLTPVIFGLIARFDGIRIGISNIELIVLELLVPFIIGHLLRPWIGTWAECNRKLLSLTDRASILLVVYSSFSAAMVHGVWQTLPMTAVLCISAITVLLLGVVLAALTMGSQSVGLCKGDEAAAVFCGSQKSLVSAVPIANVLFPAAMVGPILIPIMLYYPMQLVICAWLARRYSAGTAVAQPIPVRPA